MRLRVNKEAIEKTSEKEASEKEAIEKAAWGGFFGGGIKHQVVVLYKTAACHGSFCLQNQFFLFGIGILLFLFLIAH